MIKIGIREPGMRRLSYQYVYGVSRAEVTQRAHAVQGQLAQYGSLKAAVMDRTATFETLIEDYLCGRQLRPKTISSYRQIRERLCATLLSVPVTDLTTTVLLAWLQELAASRSPSDRLRAVKFVHSVIRHAQRRGLAPRVDLYEVIVPKVKRKPIIFWQETEIRLFLAAAQRSPEYTGFVLMLLLGLRVGEARGLRWRSVDFGRRVLRVDEQITDVDGVPTPGPPKSDRARRELHLNSSALEALQLHHAVERAAGRGRPVDYVLVARGNSPFTRNKYAEALERIAAEAGVQRLTIHGLRHSFAASAPDTSEN